MTPMCGIRQLAYLLLLNDSERSEFLLMPIRTLEGGLTVPANAYVDETEHDDIVGVGGWLGTYETWMGFGPRWLSLLPKEANGDFHYTDFWNDPTYWSANWSHAKRLERVQSLAELSAQHASIGLGIMISKSEYERIVPAEDKKGFKGAVYFCLAHCLRLLIEHYQSMPEKPPAPLRFMHDSKKGKEEWIAGWYYSVQGLFSDKNILGDLAFGRREGEPILQATDLLVGELRRYREGHHSQIVEILRRKGNILVAFPKEQDLMALVKAANASISYTS